MSLKLVILMYIMGFMALYLVWHNLPSPETRVKSKDYNKQKSEGMMYRNPLKRKKQKPAFDTRPSLKNARIKGILNLGGEKKIDINPRKPQKKFSEEIRKGAMLKPGLIRGFDKQVQGVMRKNIKRRLGPKEQFLLWKQKHKRQRALIDKVLSKKNRKGKSVIQPIKFIHGAAIFDVTWPRAKELKAKIPRIPHIIHQMWPTEFVPKVFKPWIDSLLDKHPHWQYIFWTETEAKSIIYQEYQKQYRNFLAHADEKLKLSVLKYFILHHYGGIFLDMRFEALKSLNYWFHASDCALSWENYEHTYFVENRHQPYLSEDVICATKRHPFLKLLITNLSESSNRLVSGSEYLNSAYSLHMKSNSRKAFKQSILTIHPRYWLPTWQVGKTKQIRNLCKDGALKIKPASSHQKDICRILRFNNFQNKPREDAFLVKHWEFKPGEKNITTFNIDKYLSQRKNHQKDHRKV